MGPNGGECLGEEESQLNGLGLIVNTVVLYNTIDTQARDRSHRRQRPAANPRDEDVERLRPLGSGCITVTAAAVEAERKQARRRTNDTPADPLEEARREESCQLREIAERAHGVNLDLGASLRNGLATVDPASMDVARFFVLCGRPHSTNWADLVAMPTGCAGRWRRRASRADECSERRHSYPSLSR
ncbi:MAG: hypothetical protein WCD11_05695 [Solirubrobacteraceae bacterium]